MSKCIQDGIVLISILLDLILEKTSGTGFTGMSTKSGDLLALNFRNCADSANANVPIRVYCCLYYDCVLNIKDSGCEVMD